MRVVILVLLYLFKKDLQDLIRNVYSKMSPINVLRLYVCLNGSINSRHSPRCLRNSYISLVTLPLLAYRNDEWPSYWCWVISGNCFRTRIQRTLSFWILSSANWFEIFPRFFDYSEAILQFHGLHALPIKWRESKNLRSYMKWKYEISILRICIS